MNASPASSDSFVPVFVYENPEKGASSLSVRVAPRTSSHGTTLRFKSAAKRLSALRLLGIDGISRAVGNTPDGAPMLELVLSSVDDLAPSLSSRSFDRMLITLASQEQVETRLADVIARGLPHSVERW